MTESKRRVTSDEIENAILALYLNYGPSTITADMLAERVGCSKSTIYINLRGE